MEPIPSQEGYAGFAIQNGVARFRLLMWKEVFIPGVGISLSATHLENTIICILCLHMFCLHSTILSTCIQCFIRFIDVNYINVHKTFKRSSMRLDWKPTLSLVLHLITLGHLGVSSSVKPLAFLGTGLFVYVCFLPGSVTIEESRDTPRNKT